MTGRPGKWPWKNHSVAVTPLSPTIRFASGVVLDDPVDEEERPAMRDQRLDLAGRVDRRRRGVAAAAVAGGGHGVGHGSSGASVAVSPLRGRRRGVVCRSASRGAANGASRSRGGREERGAADAVEQVRRHPALEERLVGEQRPVDRRRS